MQEFFAFVTALGSPPVVASVFVLLFIAVLILHRRHILATMLGALVSGLVVVFAAKALIERPRPVFSALTPTGPLGTYGSSFPSGHALFSVVCYGLVGFYLWRYVGTKSAKVIGILIATLLPFLIGVSRVYLGVHWVSDVIGGWAIGSLILFSWILHLERAEKRDKEEPHLRHISHLFIFVVVFAEVIFVPAALYLFAY